MQSKYPRDIKPLMTDKASMTATCEYHSLSKDELYPVGKDKQGKDLEGANPLSIHNSFSRCILSILDYSDPAQKKAVSINVKAYERLYSVFDMEARVREAYKLCLKEEFMPSPKGDVPACYTVPLTGKYQGKTAAAMMLENPDANRKVLTAQWKYLNENLSKYPSNKKQMDAIAEAINMFDAGKLKQEAFSSRAFTVFEIPTKIPNSRKLDSDGKSKICSLKITCNLDMDNPFCVEIMNARASIVQNARNKDLNNFKDVVDSVTLKFRAKPDDLMGFIRTISDRLRQFEGMYAPTYFKEAEKMSWKPTGFESAAG